jgi:glutamate N-acetyltransferase/amino-acid N-acetyltransferase
MRTAVSGCRAAAKALGVSAYDVIPCSTGKIGVLLAEAALVRGARHAADALAADGLWRAARAMMTTDAFPKVAVRHVRLGRRDVTVAGLAKGAGMIAPDLATLLVCIVTDARVAAPALRGFLRATVATSFNAITVDGDTSTNDTVVALANGAAETAALTPGTADGRRFAAALGEVVTELSDMVVADGEGATKRVHVAVTGARSDADARRLARAIAESQLVKTAFFGADPNWGRIVCAAGYAGVPLRPERTSVRIGPVSRRTVPAKAASVVVLRSGTPANERTIRRAAVIMRRPAFAVTVDAGTAGDGHATIVTSDLSPAYVEFNGAYST